MKEASMLTLLHKTGPEKHLEMLSQKDYHLHTSVMEQSTMNIYRNRDKPDRMKADDSKTKVGH